MQGRSRVKQQVELGVQASLCGVGVPGGQGVFRQVHP